MIVLVAAFLFAFWCSRVSSASSCSLVMGMGMGMGMSMRMAMRVMRITLWLMLTVVATFIVAIARQGSSIASSAV